MLQHTAEQTDQEICSAFIGQYYSQSTSHPRDIFLPIDLPREVGNALQLRLHKAQRGLKRKLLLMGQENAAEHLRREKNNWLSAEAKARLGLQELSTALQLEGAPKRIEMYDISNIQGKHSVGSMVVFENGLPKKSDYRKFAIKTVVGPDDMHSLAEVLRRRFARHDEAGWPMPDLIVLDGGKPQLSVVIKSVPGLLQAVPVVALAKREEEIFVPRKSTPIRLPKDSQELFLIQRIRDEAHRFAIGYYRSKHGRETIKSVLDEVPGLGPEHKRKLISTFGSVEGIRRADDAAVAKVLGEKLTEKLRQYV
jgi:excinuclease ABC subunit C